MKTSKVKSLGLPIDIYRVRFCDVNSEQIPSFKIIFTPNCENDSIADFL